MKDWWQLALSYKKRCKWCGNTKYKKLFAKNSFQCFTESYNNISWSVLCRFPDPIPCSKATCEVKLGCLRSSVLSEPLSLRNLLNPCELAVLPYFFFGGFAYIWMLWIKVSQILNGAADASWNEHYFILKICKVATKNENFEVDFHKRMKYLRF